MMKKAAPAEAARAAVLAPAVARAAAQVPAEAESRMIRKKKVPVMIPTIV